MIYKSRVLFAEMGCTESEVVTKESLKSELMRVKFACEVRRNRRKD